jgi:hypothetical protein
MHSSKDAAAPGNETEMPKALSAPYPDECHVRFWHLADIHLDAEYVWFRGQSGHL